MQIGNPGCESSRGFSCSELRALESANAVGDTSAIFALTVAVSTSNSFLIPTHQVNALIMGPAGYKVTDFMTSGGIMTVLFLVVSLGVMNLMF